MDSGNSLRPLASTNCINMKFIFEIADKHRDRTWVKYPRTFKSIDEAELFKARFLEVAPAWRIVRIREIFVFGANEKSPSTGATGNDHE